MPNEENEEMVLIYEVKRLAAEQAEALVAKIMKNQNTAIDTLAREELSIDPDELYGSPCSADVTLFFMFRIRAIIPIVIFLLLTGQLTVNIGILASGLGLFEIGAGLSRQIGRSILYSETRQLVLGFVAAGITFGVRQLIWTTRTITRMVGEVS